LLSIGSHERGSKLGNNPSAAILVGLGLACRSRDLVKMEAAHINLEKGVILVERKASLLSKTRDPYQEKTITCPTSRNILQVLCLRHPAGKLFPRLDTSYINSLIRAVAKEQQWDPELLWTGLHNLRHGAAARWIRYCHERLKELGGWKSSKVARWYARQWRTYPRKAPASNAKVPMAPAPITKAPKAPAPVRRAPKAPANRAKHARKQ
jgi:integrase